VSPYIVQYYGSLWAAKNRLWILMEYCQAGSVRDLMESTDQPMKEKQIAFVLRTTLQGLAYLHQQTPPITHFDVKANNILITSRGATKLADFGLARKIDSANTGRRPVAGTRYWMAPELFERGQPKAGPPADIWSLGITALELAYGKPPYSDMGPMEAMRAIVELPPPCLSDFWKDVDGNSSPWSPAFEDFVSRCLTKEPEQRPTAVMLLSHPFMASAMHQKVLYKSLSRRNKLLKQNQAKKARPRLAQLFSKAREKSIREEIDRRDWDEEEDSEKSNSLTEGRSEDREPSGEIIDENQKGSAFLMTESLSPTEAKTPLLSDKPGSKSVHHETPPESKCLCCCLF